MIKSQNYIEFLHIQFNFWSFKLTRKFLEWKFSVTKARQNVIMMENNNRKIFPKCIKLWKRKFSQREGEIYLKSFPSILVSLSIYMAFINCNDFQRTDWTCTCSRIKFIKSINSNTTYSYGEKVLTSLGCGGKNLKTFSVLLNI